jgi:cell division protein FtsA
VGKKGEIVGAVDFGSRCVRALIANQSDDGGVQVLGHGVAPSRGCVSQGVIQDVAAAQRALKVALQAAEKEASTRVTTLFCGINGRNVETTIREGTVKIDKETVELSHMEEALDQASRPILSPGHKVVFSVTSQEWYVDEMRVGDPVGIRGSVLKCRVHFAKLPSVIEDNITNCIESQGRDLEDVVYMPLAASLGCLTPEDIDLGVAVLDMGHSTGGLAMYRDRRIMTSTSFEWGGFHITRDVSAGLHVSFEEAAELIMEYGVPEAHIRALAESEGGDLPDSLYEIDPDNASHIKLQSVVRGAANIVDRAELDMIIFERSKELMMKVRQYLVRRQVASSLVRGIVLTGGAAQIRNMDLLAEVVFQAPARIGQPEGIELMPQPVNAPEFVPALGVCRHGFEYRKAIQSGRIQVHRGPISNAFRGLFRVVSQYFF